MTTETMRNKKFLSTVEAANYLNLSPGYLAYLRTDTAKEQGHKGPAYYRVDLKDGSPNPIRIKYDELDLKSWAAQRDAQRASEPPQIERVSG